METVDTARINLEELANGAVAEIFNAELHKALVNIDDPNTDAEAVRTVTLKVKLKPASDRRYIQIGVEADSKLARNTPVIKTSAYIGLVGGQMAMTEIGYGQIPGQMSNKDFVDVKVENETQPNAAAQAGFKQGE